MRLALGGKVLLRGFVWAVCLASAAQAQPITPLAPSSVTTVPHLPQGLGARLASVSNDGHRIAVTIRLANADEFRVIDTRSGAVLFARVAQPVNQVRLLDTLLAPEGNTVVYGEVSANQPETKRYLARDIRTGDTRLLGEAPASTYLVATSTGARVVVVNTLRYPALMTVFRAGGTPLEVVDTCAGPASVPLFGQTLLSGDGSTLVFTRAWNPGQAVEVTASVVVDTSSGALQCLQSAPLPPGRLSLGPVHLTTDGRWLTDPSAVPASGPGVGQLRHLPADTRKAALPSFWRSRPLATSDDGRVVLSAGSPTASSDEGLFVFDQVRGDVTSVIAPDAIPAGSLVTNARLTGDGTTVVFELLAIPSLTSTVYVGRLDLDRDGMPDTWEATFGLDSSTPLDALQDPDDDGATNAAEFTAGTHPRGAPVRFFSEGAHGRFFATSLALFAPASTSTVVNLRFLGPSGETLAWPVIVPAPGSAFVNLDDVGLPFSEFGIVVEAPVPVAAERRMTWDRTGLYGSHSSSGVGSPSTTWHFAEGATIAGMQTFFLLQNPGDAPATATLRYLLATGNVQERVHTVPARSRLTVWANQEGAPLDAAEFSTTVVSDRPLVAERAMYRDAPGEMFAAGSVAAGVAAPATSWFFAEGATGAFFDTYLLLANPNDAPATVSVEFIRAHEVGDIATALPIGKTYVLTPHSRRTIWVAQEDPGLVDTQVGARMQSDLPIVAERTMWWPGPTAASWRENDAEFGSPESGRLWAVADVQADADDGGWDTFVLVATTEQLLSNIRVSVSCDDGTTVTRDKSLSVNRTTLWMRHEFPEIVGRRCAATVESLPTRITLSPMVPLYRTPLVVEKAIYRGHFEAGGVALATRLPDPP